MGTDLLDGDVELTEFEAIEVEAIKGVRQGANGFPILLMKGLAKADGDMDGPTHGAFDGSHTHDHAGPDGSHSHEHAHDGDGDHGHAHGTQKSAGPPAWHAPAAQLARLAAMGQFPLASEWTLLKAVDADGNVDETPDIDGGKQAIALIAKLIGYEAAELGAGEIGETYDIGLLLEAAGALKCWLRREQASQTGADAYGDDGAWPDMDDVVMASIAEPLTYPADEVAKDSREFSAAERKKHAAAGNALPDGSYPIPDADALRRAAILARSKHGNWQAARRLIARRAKELGVANPLAQEKTGASKGTVAEGEGAVDTGTQGTGGLSKAVEDALTKALAPIQGELEALRVFKAKVEAAPVPGGPMISTVRAQTRAPGGEEWAAKAAYYRDMAETVTDRVSADGYRKLAREADDKAKATPAITS